MKKLINLERLKVKLANDFNVTVKAIDKYLQTHVFNHEISELSQKEINQVIKETDLGLKGIFGVFVANLKSDWRGLFVHRYKTEMADAIKDNLKEPKKLQDYADKVFLKPLQMEGSLGVTLDDMLNAFSTNERKKITNAIRLAHHEGLTNAKLIQMIRGSKARNYQDGILKGVTTRNARTIAQTGTAIMASQAQQEFISQNLDIAEGIKVVATLDLRTSAICRGRDGMIMPLERAVYPPYHYNCRSTTEVVYKGYKAPTHRASMHGVAKNQTYYEWLKEQPPEYHDEVLGKARAKLFRDGGLSLQRFKELQLDKNFTPLTLDEMKALEPTAFKRTQ